MFANAKINIEKKHKVNNKWRKMMLQHPLLASTSPLSALNGTRRKRRYVTTYENEKRKENATELEWMGDGWIKTGEILCKTETRPKMNVSTYLNLTCRCTEVFSFSCLLGVWYLYLNTAMVHQQIVPIIITHTHTGTHPCHICMYVCMSMCNKDVIKNFWVFHVWISIYDLRSLCVRLPIHQSVYTT